jgi:hypothetical protein
MSKKKRNIMVFTAKDYLISANLQPSIFLPLQGGGQAGDGVL